jgi:heat shock protein HslJ
MRIAVAALLALALLGGAGCASSSLSSPTVPDNSKLLEGHAWKATEVAGVPSLVTQRGVEITAVFAAGKLAGSGSVNRYTATYETQAADKIKISQPAATAMAGPPAAMAQEQAYFSALAKAASFAVTADSLKLLDDQGKTLVAYIAVKPTTLEGTQWEATMYNNGQGGLQSLAASSSITAQFSADGKLAGNASINQYSTTYKASGDTMAIDAKIVTTMMAGPDDLMKQEAAYLAALPKTATYVIDGDEMWLRDSSGAATAVYVAK